MPRRCFTMILIGVCAVIAGTAPPMVAQAHSKLASCKDPCSLRHNQHLPHSLPSPIPTPSLSPAPNPTTSPTPTPAPTTAPTPSPSPSPSPTPPPAGWPGPANTGVPTGTVLAPSGSISVTVDGTVINALDVTGYIYINANNVTVKNTRIRDGSLSYAGYQVRVESGHTSVLIEDTEIDGLMKTSANNPNDGDGISGRGFTALRDNIHGSPVGIGVGDATSQVLVQDTWIHDLYQTALSHNQDFLTNGSTGGITLRHNTLSNPIDEVSAISLFGDFAPVQNVTVDNNLLNGGDFGVYGGHDPSKPYGTQDANVKFTNNHFGRTFYATCSLFGPVTAFSSASAGNVWSGNVWDDTGVIVPPAL